ncbi:hypothetical protein MUDCAT_85 [Arthrobacter phage Mudcat]|uniref:Uncharacterized protein n=5 Tax=Mudcatvirus TaxID=1982088 RepID=A0A222Z897_9CAUD|nr:hypothetical protein BI184_gp85 [Arthrobacter phage Mudcat]YP_010666177.1 hypothetical protein PQB75_gp092 [Arthrobacter phage Tribby]YP_010666278.1 hypothetical protein PQB76_gp091 [Arthrobacter phage Cheesy]YP_010666568.1 hypothetical protein PQB79_gp089 [Arthrobacter phage Heisenberger]YP_010666668.1 hypothetical protein PQB80_gp089 [Arthrobacter phage JEGGS]AMM44452.1 hypothetical protein MUDCAT_85 [Arthrobacter phage Mudcat]ASR80343.1 hypothetical protein SEA_HEISENBERGER_89 [Arthroba
MTDRIITPDEIEHWKRNRHTLEFATLIINSRIADDSRHDKLGHLRRLSLMTEEITKSIMDAESVCQCGHIRAEHEETFGCTERITLDGRPDICQCLGFKAAQ